MIHKILSSSDTVYPIFPSIWLNPLYSSFSAEKWGRPERNGLSIRNCGAWKHSIGLKPKLIQVSSEWEQKSVTKETRSKSQD